MDIRGKLCAKFAISPACNTTSTHARIYPSKSFLELSPSKFSNMRLSACTCYLASLMATLVLVTMSLPQSPSGPPDPIAKRILPINPVTFSPHRGCLTVRAITHRFDVEGSRNKAVLATKSLLPCGILMGRGQTGLFRFATTRTVRLRYSFGGTQVSNQYIIIVEFNPKGGDPYVKFALADYYELTGFTPKAEKSYYIKFYGAPPLTMSWFFTLDSRVYAFPARLSFRCCIGILIRQNR